MLPYVIALLAVIAMALMFLSVRHAREVKANGGRGGSSPGPPEAAVLERLPSRTLPQSMRLASLQLQRLVAGGSGVYEVPWVVAVGAGSADLDRLLPEQLPWPPDLAGAHQAVLGQVGRISFCRTGAVLGFDDGLLDGPEWRQRWHSLVRALQTCRPGRPVQRTACCDSRLRAAGVTGIAGSAGRRSDQIYHLIWSVQRMTGWRIPVYLLVSGCEELTGFADWVLALPRQARQQVLGWSCRTPSTAFFRTKMGRRGDRGGRQAAVGCAAPLPDARAGGRGPRGPPAVSGRGATARRAAFCAPHRHAANQRLSRGVHVSRLLSGGARAGRGRSGSAIGRVRPRRCSRRKCFRSTGSLSPLTGRQPEDIARSALPGCPAAVAVLCLIGVMHIQRVKSDYLPPVYTSLSGIGQQVSARALQRDNPQVGAARRERVRDVALRLLNAMAAIQIDRIDTIAAPTSLLSFANSRVEQAIATGYSVAVFGKRPMTR